MNVSIFALFLLWTVPVLSSALLNSSACGLNSDLSPDSNSDLATDLNVTELPADEFYNCLDILHSTCCDSCESVSYKDVLLEAVAKKDYKRIRKVLKVARVTSPDFLLSNGETIFSNFVVLDDLEGVRFAIDTLGCDVSYRISKVLTTDFTLRRCRSRQMFRLLVQKGADINAKLEFHPNLQNFTMLQYAVVNNFAWIVDELVRADADDRIVDSYGNRASAVAEHYGNKTILGYFKKLQ
jgi:hypothetical protein